MDNLKSIINKDMPDIVVSDAEVDRLRNNKTQCTNDVRMYLGKTLTSEDLEKKRQELDRAEKGFFGYHLDRFKKYLAFPLFH